MSVLFLSFIGFRNAKAASITQNELEFDRFQKLGIKLDSWSEGQIQFWEKVYTHYGTADSILHDSTNLTRIYLAVKSQASSGAPAQVEKAKREIQANLNSIYEKNKLRKAIDPEKLTNSERNYYEILEANEDPRAYQFAANRERIRVQVGQKDRLENAYSISKRYLKRMEEIFVEEGVPKELTRLPFIESGFIKEARSSVGALGVWQFMPKTGEKQLKINTIIDERYDPLKSTRAAAKFLKQNYQQLQNWGLAIMAYHHGAGLVSKAIKKLKTRDPIVIIRLFKDPSFKFASRNYLFEFLAMLDVDAKQELFFKNLNLSPLPAYVTVSFPKKMEIKTILNHYHLNFELTRMLNPHFLSPIWQGKALIPAHYPVRLTGITLEEFQKLGYPQE